MDDSDSNLNGSYTEFCLNSTFTNRRESTSKEIRLAEAKQKNARLASLHERAKLLLAKLDKCEERYVDSEIAKIEQQINKFGPADYAFYRVQSREMLLQMIETAEAVEAKMYEDLEELRDLIWRCFDKKPNETPSETPNETPSETPNETPSDRQNSDQEQ